MTKKMKDTFLFQPPFNFYEIDFIEIEILLKLIWSYELPYSEIPKSKLSYLLVSNVHTLAGI